MEVLILVVLVVLVAALPVAKKDDVGPFIGWMGRPQWCMDTKS